MAIGVGGVSDPRAPRRPPTHPERRGRHRVVLAAIASVLTSLVLCVPLAYQAHSAREDGRSSDRSDSTTSTDAPSSIDPPTTETTVPTRVLPSTLERSDADLTWAATIDDPAPLPLEGATLRGTVVVQFQLPPDTSPVRSAEFWVDRIDGEGPAARVDEVAPFTLGDGGPEAPGSIDTHELDDGTHLVIVVAIHDDGSTVERTSRFQVDNG